ncbi:unnamed protein product [Anisakis simplex]|uniref:Neurotransmitter-gated ion-channel transmembrane domain-containing protein n=1 Tax=Anisakis simplex TaxID=6269 RepID=A0A3P6NE69_ANISI|nr:unnamed protein product [Anisakis simplex]
MRNDSLELQAVDVYLGFCYLFVAMALIEYACVAYATKKHNDQLKKYKKREDMMQTQTLQTPDLLRDARIDECTCEQGTSVFATIAKRPFKLRCIKHNRIDLIARILFPASVSEHIHCFLIPLIVSDAIFVLLILN